MRKLIIILILCSSIYVSGQEMLGMVSGNFSGSQGITLNPSSVANNKLLFDVNILTIHGFVQNNYFYLPKREGSLINIISGAYQFPFYAKPFGEGIRAVYSYYNEKTYKDAFVNVRVMGPSVMWRCKDHSFVIHMATRSMTSGRDFPYDIANFSFYTMDFQPQHNINFINDDYRVTSMAWGELGFTYAAVIARSGTNHWSAGITVNKLFGYAATYVDGGYTDYIVYNDSIINVKNLNVEYGLALPMDYNTDQAKFTDDKIKGGGWSFDIGMTWQYKKRGYQKRYKHIKRKQMFDSYDFKLGVSILDIGYVNYKKNAEKHAFMDASNNHINVGDFTYDNVYDEFRDVSEALTGDPEASYVDNKFMIYLPAALSVQADYNVRDPWYLSGMVIIPVKYASPMIERSSVIALIPRYETRYLEINIPISLYQYRYPRIGFSVRIWDLAIGSDNLSGFFGYKDFTGMDFYVSYKVNIAKKSRAFEKKNPCYYNF